MPNVIVSDLKHRILSAMADEMNTTPDVIVDRMLDDLQANRAGIRPEFPAAVVEGIVAAMESTGKAAKLARERRPNPDAGR
jgi:hypothetical protein